MIKRLQAFGIVLMQIEHNKICDNVHLQLNVYNDDVVTGLCEKDYVIAVADGINHLAELFDTQKKATLMTA